MPLQNYSKADFGYAQLFVPDKKRPGSTIAYLPEYRILVDAGHPCSYSNGSPEKLPEFLSGLDIKELYLSHLHIDHIGLLWLYLERGISVYAAEQEIKAAKRDIGHLLSQEFSTDFDKRAVEEYQKQLEEAVSAVFAAEQSEIYSGNFKLSSLGNRENKDIISLSIANSSKNSKADENSYSHSKAAAIASFNGLLIIGDFLAGKTKEQMLGFLRKAKGHIILEGHRLLRRTGA